MSKFCQKIKIYRTKILSPVLYGCANFSLMLKEEHRLMIFEKKILRRIFWTKKNDSGEWRKPHNDKLYSLCHSSNVFGGD